MFMSMNEPPAKTVLINNIDEKTCERNRNIIKCIREHHKEQHDV